MTSATPRPLGITDVTGSELRLAAELYGDHWYWCRRHERAEHASWPHLAPVKQPCIRIGPFMSEREADRLNGIPKVPAGTHPIFGKPLGMEVEK